MPASKKLDRSSVEKVALAQKKPMRSVAKKLNRQKKDTVTSAEIEPEGNILNSGHKKQKVETSIKKKTKKKIVTPIAEIDKNRSDLASELKSQSQSQSQLKSEFNLNTRAGFVALIGPPNAGKSTLLNSILGEKLSIVSDKAQTTRTRVLGLMVVGNTQIGLVDTPGIFKPKGRMDTAMVDQAWQSLEDADAVVVLADASARQPDERLERIVHSLKKRGRRAILVLNKIDKMKAEDLLPIAQQLDTKDIFDKIFMISAIKKKGVSDLMEYVTSLMPVGPWLYPEDQLTDMPERLMAAELTREQIFNRMREELPYSVLVKPMAWEERKDGSILIRQTVLVKRAAHRMMVLGKNGAQIKAIGAGARKELETILQTKVHLFLEVGVDEAWQERGEFYELFGL